MTRRAAAVSLATALLLGSFRTLRASDTASDRATLKGITALYVLVESLDDDAQKIGLTKEAIQTDVELKLRLAGIRVVTEDEDLNLPGAPYLYVTVNVVPPETASVTVELHQSARLERNGAFVFGASTWDVSTLISNTRAQGIRDVIKDRVDQFLNAWLSVNPKN